MKLAIFDLDNTLLGGDSDHAWGEFLISAGLVDEKTHRARNNEFYRQYQEGGLDIVEYAAFAAGPIAGKNPNLLKDLHDQFMRDFVMPMMLPAAQTLLARHREDGDYLLIITATNHFITAPIARHLGVDELIATDLEQVDGIYTGRLQGIPCFQDGKVKRLTAWLEQYNTNCTNVDLRLDIGNSIFYSDSFNDLPLLEHAAEAVAVDPDDTLREQARQRGWPVISLRDPY